MGKRKLGGAAAATGGGKGKKDGATARPLSKKQHLQQRAAALEREKAALAEGAARGSKRAAVEEEAEVEEEEESEEHDFSRGDGDGGSGSCSDSSSEEDDDDSEDDIKMYGEGAVSSSDNDSEYEEEEEEPPAKGKGKGKQPANKKDAAAAAASAATTTTSSSSSKKKQQGADGDVVEVSFDFSDPEEKFFFGIRALLQWMADEGVDVTSLAELVVQEKGLGSVIHCTDEADVFALATTLNVQAHLEAQNDGMRTLCARLLEARCPASLRPSLQAALASPETYIYIHARFVNLPLPLVPLLHKSGEEDRKWAQDSDPQLPRIKTLVTISPCTVDLGKGSASPSVPYAPNDAIFDRFEDELLVQAAEASYCFPRSLAPAGASASSAKEEEEDESDDDDGRKKKKKGKGKRKKESAVAAGAAGGGGAAASSQGYVVSLVPGAALAVALPQMEEMVG